MYGITLTLAVLTAATLLLEAVSERHPFPSECTCKWNKLPGKGKGCSFINTPDEYPDYEEMFGNAECLPAVPVK